jgi:hypothetical protein
MRSITLGQGIYYAATGIWPLVHMRSFLRVTGPKTDLWLVRTVGVLVGAIGAALLAAGARNRQSTETRILGAGSALGLAAVDVNYAARGVISPVYLLDAAAELALGTAWLLDGLPARSLKGCCLQNSTPHAPTPTPYST